MKKTSPIPLAPKLFSTIEIEDVFADLNELNGFLRSYFGKKHHDYSDAINYLKKMLKREMQLG